MSKLLPKKYGERLDVSNHIDLAAQISLMSPAERLAPADELLAGAVKYYHCSSKLSANKPMD